MGITSALTTGLSGLAANQLSLNVVGNNIANVNTVGYKSQSLDFQTQFAQTFTYGTQPQNPDGGTNPFQIGNGTQDAATTTNFSTGSQEVTGVNTNLSLQGDGFFVLQDSQQLFTRDGTFQLNSQNKLVNGNGLFVQGYGVDSSFNVIPGVLGDINIPLGSLTVAQATSNITLDGNLSASGAVPTTATNSTLDQPLYLAGSGAVSGTAPASSDLLTNITDATNTPMFQQNDVITLQGSQNGRSLAPQTFTVGAGSTLGDLESFMNGTLGIDTTAGINGSANAPGVAATTTGNHVALGITGNTGTENDLTLNSSSMTIDRAGTTLAPFTFTKNATSDGESAYTTMQAYDSLGNPITVNVTATLASDTTSGTTWNFIATSPDGTNTGALTNDVIGQGTLSYNTSGQLTASTGTDVSVDRSGSGTAPALGFTLNFNNTTALAGSSSSLASTLQDGSPQGTLTSFSIGNNGVIAGSFSNGLTRTLGQVAVATFRNDEGLVSQGNNDYTPGPNSGTPVISTPGQGNAGTIVAGSLELSNVDLASQFVDLISASTGFSAASRVITTGDQMLQSLLSSLQ